MSNENETKEATKSNKKYVVLALVVILAAVGIVMNNNTEQTSTEPTTVASAEQAQVTEETPVVDEPTIAAIAITTKLVDADVPQFEVYIDGSDIPEKQAKWLSNYKIQGYTISNNKGHIDITINVLNDTKILIALRGKYLLDENKKIVEKWVKYTSLTINDVPVLNEPIEVWHNKPFNYTLDTDAGEIYKIHIEWTKADK